MDSINNSGALETYTGLATLIFICKLIAFQVTKNILVDFVCGTFFLTVIIVLPKDNSFSRGCSGKSLK